jgi:hypothetical protein
LTTAFWSCRRVSSWHPGGLNGRTRDICFLQLSMHGSGVGHDGPFFLSLWTNLQESELAERGAHDRLGRMRK